MNSKKERFIKIYNNPIIILFLVFPFIKPVFFQYILPALNNFFDFWKLLSVIIILLLYIYNRKISKIIIAIVLYEMALLFSTFINDGDYKKSFIICGTIIAFSMLTELCIKYDSKTFFKSIFFIYFILIIINFLLLLIYSGGIFKTSIGESVNFLGIDNLLSPIFIPIMALSCIYAAFQNKNQTFWTLLLLTIISMTTIITWSATGVAMWFVMAAYILFIYKKKQMPVINIRMFYIVFIVLQVAIVFLRLQNIFAFIIEDILGKSITFTGRTIVWDAGIQFIKQSPILGHGVYDGYAFMSYYLNYSHFHNGVIEVLVQGGLVALVLYILAFLFAGNKLYKYRHHYISGIISAGIFAMLVGMLMEPFIDSILLYGLLVCGYHISEIVTQLENSNEKTRHHYQ